jgi:outer membrane protein OmpA-like peptidoglycan-associated protein
MEANQASAYWRHLGRLRGYALFQAFVQQGIAAERIGIISGGHIHRESIAGGPRQDNRVRLVYVQQTFPVPRITWKGTVPTNTSIAFGYDSAEIDGPSHEALDELAAYLAEHKESTAQVFGHSDLRGTSGFNRILSRLRSLVVLETLVRQGTGSDRIKVESFGFSRPVVPSKGGDADSKNRRVEVLVSGETPTAPIALKAPEDPVPNPGTQTPVEAPQPSAAEDSSRSPWLLAFHLGPAQTRGTLTDRLNTGLGASAMVGRPLLTWQEHRLFAVGEWSYSQFTKSDSIQKNKLNDMDLSLGVLLDYKLTGTWFLLGHAAVGLSHWNAWAKENSTGLVQTNASNDLLVDCAAAFGYRMNEEWSLTGRGLVRTVGGDFNGGYQIWSLGVIKEILP